MLTEAGWVALLDPANFDEFSLTHQWISREGAIEGGAEHLEIYEDLDDKPPRSFWVGRVCSGDPIRCGPDKVMQVTIVENLIQVTDGNTQNMDADE